MRCEHCFGEHEPDTPEDYVEDHEGKRYTAPFKCVCCGKEICARQFAYGFRCGVCDMGACNSLNKAYVPEFAHEQIKEFEL